MRKSIFISITIIALFVLNVVKAESFSGCMESYLDNLIREASMRGKAMGEHMGYDISMLRYYNNQQCIVDIAIYSGQTLVDRRMVKCINY